MNLHPLSGPARHGGRSFTWWLWQRIAVMLVGLDLQAETPPPQLGRILAALGYHCQCSYAFIPFSPRRRRNAVHSISALNRVQQLRAKRGSAGRPNCCTSSLPTLPCREILAQCATLFRRFFRKSVGFALGQNVPADPADHAEDFAHCYAEPLDWLVGIRMEELGIPNERIGSSDHEHGLACRAFNPNERTGGGNGPGGQVNVDSGVFNPELLTMPYSRKTAKLWRKSRLRDRIDAIIAHEISEADHGSHEIALKMAPHTELPISERAREILVAMRIGWRGR